MSKELKAPDKVTQKNDPRRCGCGKPHDGRNVQYQRKAAGRKLFSPPQGVAAEKVVQHIGAEIERHAAKGAEEGKKALDATQPKTHSSPLAVFRSGTGNAELQKAIKKSDKAADCLDAARGGYPQADQNQERARF